MQLIIKRQLIQKEELQVLLDQYKSILTLEIFEYLTELLELKISVIKEMQLELNKNKTLNELPLYKQIALYNIYYRAFNIANEIGMNPLMSRRPNNLKKLSLFTKIGEDYVPLFLFHTKKEDEEEKSIIDLYRIMFDIDVRAQVLSEMRLHLQNLREESGTYLSFETENYILLQYYEDLVKKLECKKELSNEELRQIKLTQSFQQLLIEDYGLTQDSFVDETEELLKQAKNEDERFFLRCKFALENYTSPYAIKSPEKEIVLVKKFSNIEIRNRTKYII